MRKSFSVASLVIFSLLGCSSDKKKSAAPVDASVDGSAAFDSGPAADAAAAADGGTATEGSQCVKTADCGKGLSCVSDFNGSIMVGICARACASDTDCGTERCFSETGNAADAHCVNVVRKEFGTCGLASTSVCGQPLLCLYYSRTSAEGLCVNLCMLPPAPVDAGTDDAGAEDGGTVAKKDAGAANQDAGTANLCSTSQTCLSGIVDSPNHDKGLCGTTAARGKACGLEMGIFCDTGDICEYDAPGSSTAARHCYQDCTTTNKCDKGTCTPDGSLGYCL